ncbi:unnamed protein product [Brugia pahangi]|uniref:GDNF domain-containing protein n=1 Tax=Brugia pahangi TaxID=6280 RepID=A0A0N4TRH1_BRUPA|nr:unnamed protein product [Brugia pahangi]
MDCLQESTVRCFCDKQNCEDSLICTGELCLIGFRSEDSQAHMEQLCSNAGDARDLAKCQHNWNGWQEVCACEEDFCNTFAYLRGSIEESTDNVADSQPLNLVENVSVDDFSQFTTHLTEFINLSTFCQQNKMIMHFQKESSIGSVGRHRGSNLIILLVIIPLSVGALAVCLIFINYHCKMC